MQIYQYYLIFAIHFLVSLFSARGICGNPRFLARSLCTLFRAQGFQLQFHLCLGQFVARLFHLAAGSAAGNGSGSSGLGNL